MDCLRETTRFMKWAACLGVPGVTALWGFRVATGLAIGVLWGLVNFWVIGKLMEPLTMTDRPGLLSRAWWWVVKLPVLYGVGVVCLLSPWSSPVGFLVGFSMWWVVLWANAFRQTSA